MISGDEKETTKGKKKKLQLTPQKYKGLYGTAKNNYIPINDNLEEVDIFFKRYNLPRLSQEEIENMSRLITKNEI